MLGSSSCLGAWFAWLLHCGDLIQPSILDLRSLSFRDLRSLLCWNWLRWSVDLRLFRRPCRLLQGCFLELSWIGADQIFWLCPNLIKVSWFLFANFWLLLLGLAAKNWVYSENGSTSLTIVEVGQCKFEFWHLLEILVAHRGWLAKLLLELELALDLCYLSQIVP